MMKILGKLVNESVESEYVTQVTDLRVGINSTKDHIISLDENRNINYVISKVCDHAGGKLIVKGGTAVCPMHNWILNLESLEYNNSHICKEHLEYDLKSDGTLVIPSNDRSLRNPFNGLKKGKVILRWLNHATINIECNGVSIITDPWLFGPAFLTGWWLANPSPVDSIDILKKIDFIYISHNHPDHLHAETLSIVDRNTPIITANFYSKSSKTVLEKLGFNNIFTPDFLEIFEFAPNFYGSILKSGDFRDDSGLYISANGHEILLTVDSNFLNNHNLPINIDLLLSSFAGGASGFPLCYENYNEIEKTKIIKRSRNSIKLKVLNYVKFTQAKYFMPYAGMFAEYSRRDSYILEKNYKIKAGDYNEILKNVSTNLISPISTKSLVFKDGELDIQEEKNMKLISKEDTDFYIDTLKREYQYNAQKIVSYLKKSKFFGNQILQIIPTNDDFDQRVGEIVYADFKNQKFLIGGEEILHEEMEGLRVMQLKIRAEVLMCVIENYLPWEDFAIGFQMRVSRFPNEYESDFWYHFTNVYVAKENFRYSSYCGACTVVEQNPIWIKD